MRFSFQRYFFYCCTVALFTILNHSRAVAQPYIRAGVGYGFSSGSVVLLHNWTYDQSTGVTNYEDVDGSNGRGINFNVSAGKVISDQFAFELGLSYTAGAAYTSTQTYLNDPTFPQPFVNTTSSSVFSIAPVVVISAGQESVHPYARFGPVLAFPSLTTTESGQASGQTVFSGPAAIGYCAGAGVTYQADQALSWFAEASFVSLTWNPTSSTFTNASGSGTHDFNDTYSSANGGTSQEDLLPFGTIGIQIGMVYTLK